MDATSNSAQPAKRNNECCTNFKNKMSMKTQLESVHGRAPSDELKERRRRCFIATSLSKDSQDKMAVDESKSRRFILAMTKEQEIDFFKSLWNSVPENPSEDLTLPKPPEQRVLKEVNKMSDSASDPKRASDGKKIYDMIGSQFEDEVEIRFVTIGDGCSNTEPVSNPAPTVKTGKIATHTRLDSGEIQGNTDSLSTGCDSCRPLIGDSNNAMTVFPDVDGHSHRKNNVCDQSYLASNRNIPEYVSPRDVNQSKTSIMSTNDELPNCNCVSSSMKGNVKSVGQSPSINTRTFPTWKSHHSEPDLSHVDEVSHLTKGTETDSNGYKETRNVLIQTTPIKKCYYSGSGLSLGEKGYSVQSEARVNYKRERINDNDLMNKRQPRNTNIYVKNRQRHHFGETSSSHNRRSKYSYAGQRQRMINQYDKTQCACFDQCLKGYTSRQNVYDWCKGCKKGHTSNNKSVPHTKVQFQMSNSCSNCNAKTNNYCLPHLSTEDSHEDFSNCGCLIQNKRNVKMVHRPNEYFNSRMAKQKNNNSRMNVKTCGLKHLNQDVPIPISNRKKSFRRPPEDQPLLERCSCDETPRYNEEIQEEHPDDVAFCDVCGVRGNSERQMVSHYNGNRHYRTMRQSEKKFQSGERVFQSTHAEDMKVGSKTDDQVMVLTLTSDRQHLNPLQEYVIVRKTVILV